MYTHILYCNNKHNKNDKNNDDNNNNDNSNNHNNNNNNINDNTAQVSNCVEHRLEFFQSLQETWV